MPGLLQPLGGEQLDEVAHVQARRRRVEAHVERDRSPIQLGAQGVAIGRVGEQPALFEVVQDVRRHHGLLPG
jgi:hypothetical protein